MFNIIVIIIIIIIIINSFIIHIELSLKYISVFKEHKNTSGLFTGMKAGLGEITENKELLEEWSQLITAYRAYRGLHTGRISF